MLCTLKQHRIFLCILFLALIVRVIAVAAYYPALWFPDSSDYARAGWSPYPPIVRPAGYSLILIWPLRFLHSFGAVVIAQHLLGLLAGILIYLMLKKRIPTWAAALATVPVLLSVYQIQNEQFLLSDTLFTFLMVSAIIILLWRPSPPWWACALAGLLLGAAAITRSEGLPLILAALFWIGTRHAKWYMRLVGMTLTLALFLIPVGGYALWFKHENGDLRLTQSTGAFMASRMESFASCAGVSLPINEKWLCTKPGLSPDYYLWAANAPLFTRKSGEFSSSTDRLATNFAIRMAVSHPFGYIISTWRTFLQNFSSGGNAYGDGQASFLFPSKTPESVIQLANSNRDHDALVAIYKYDSHPSTTLRQPWVGILQVYQQIFVFSPILVGLVFLGGLGSVILAWKRRGGPALLAWGLGTLMLVFPAATSGFGSRYELVAIAPLCIAAVLGYAELKHNAVSLGSLSNEGPLMVPVK